MYFIWPLPVTLLRVWRCIILLQATWLVCKWSWRLRTCSCKASLRYELKIQSECLGQVIWCERGVAPPAPTPHDEGIAGNIRLVGSKRIWKIRACMSLANLVVYLGCYSQDARLGHYLDLSRCLAKVLWTVPDEELDIVTVCVSLIMTSSWKWAFPIFLHPWLIKLFYF